MIDPVNDPAPRFSTRTVLGFGGWVAASALAFGSLTYADERLAEAALQRGERQLMVDAEQGRRLDRIEAKQAQQDALLFDICAAVDCRKQRRPDGQ